jgi:hypothetical protein
MHAVQVVSTIDIQTLEKSGNWGTDPEAAGSAKRVSVVTNSIGARIPKVNVEYIKLRLFDEGVFGCDLRLCVRPKS